MPPRCRPSCRRRSLTWPRSAVAENGRAATICCGMTVRRWSRTDSEDTPNRATDMLWAPASNTSRPVAPRRSTSDASAIPRSNALAARCAGTTPSRSWAAASSRSTSRSGSSACRWLSQRVNDLLCSGPDSRAALPSDQVRSSGAPPSQSVQVRTGGGLVDLVEREQRARRRRR